MLAGRAILLHQQIRAQLDLFLLAVDLNPPQTADLPLNDLVAVALKQGLRHRLSRTRTGRTGRGAPMALTGRPPPTQRQRRGDEDKQQDQPEKRTHKC